MVEQLSVSLTRPPSTAGIVSWLALQQLLDSALPIGGFSHSFGLETLVQEGSVRTTANLEEYMRAMLLQSWSTADVMVIKAVYRDLPVRKLDSLWAVERLVHVQRAAIESRTGVQKMGRRLLQLLVSLYPQCDWYTLTEGVCTNDCLATHPLVFGYACWQLGISLEQAAQGYLYACMVTCVGSALRLMSIGQTEGQSIIARLTPIAVEAWRIAESMEPEEAYSNMPLAEIAMMRHEQLYSRLFMS
ncbi:urease accessory protein UreF [Paenibacillus sp. OV219]|uniref:urease accessory protein UreF n=1 Tax=Paenibacillus sp. OV219 TaxID=1884377 RepID=UPI0008AEB716|nr:urease accessory protein UreF [Paenibacillus sp. OV219]SEO24884.1 urease accessory protein [Paenibacillus sp. OV219]